MQWRQYSFHRWSALRERIKHVRSRYAFISMALHKTCTRSAALAERRIIGRYYFMYVRLRAEWSAISVDYEFYHFTSHVARQDDFCGFAPVRITAQQRGRGEKIGERAGAAAHMYNMYSSPIMMFLQDDFAPENRPITIRRLTVIEYRCTLYGWRLILMDISFNIIFSLQKLKISCIDLI